MLGQKFAAGPQPGAESGVASRFNSGPASGAPGNTELEADLERARSVAVAFEQLNARLTEQLNDALQDLNAADARADQWYTAAHELGVA